MLQTEGLTAARVVEEATKVVKKGDDEVEVPDGLKGRIIPFEMVQKVMFRTELQSISDMEARQEDIKAEVEELQEGFTEEESQEYMEGDENPKLDKKKIKKDAKAKNGEIEPETQEKLKRLVALWDEQTKLNKTLKEARIALVDKTKEAIENLTDEEIASFLHMKWIDPVCDGINSTLTAEFDKMEKGITALASKYAVSYNDLEQQLVEAQQDLLGLIDDLTGDEFDISGLQNLIK